MASAYRLQIVHKGEVVEWMPGSKVETDMAAELCARLEARWTLARPVVNQPPQIPQPQTLMERVSAVFVPPVPATDPVKGPAEGTKEKVMLDLRDCVAEMFHDLKKKIR